MCDLSPPALRTCQLHRDWCSPDANQASLHHLDRLFSRELHGLRAENAPGHAPGAGQLPEGRRPSTARRRPTRAGCHRDRPPSPRLYSIQENANGRSRPCECRLALPARAHARHASRLYKSEAHWMHSAAGKPFSSTADEGLSLEFRLFSIFFSICLTSVRPESGFAPGAGRAPFRT